MALALAIGAGCQSSSAQTETEAPTETSTQTQASVETESPTSTSTPTSTPTPVPEPEASDEPPPSGPPLFDGVGQFGIAFDALNIQLHDLFDFERIDITQSMAKLPDRGRRGAFVMAAFDQGEIGGWVEVDGALSSVAVVAGAEAPARQSAVLTLMAVTVEDSDANIDAFNQALEEVAAGGPGAVRYLVLDDRGVLIESIEIDAELHLSVVVSDPDSEAAAVERAGRLRAAMFDRLAAA